MLDITYFRPESIAEAIQLSQDTDGILLAGGTDVLPRIRKGHYPVKALIDLSRIESLKFVQEVNGWIEIGSSTTHTMVDQAQLLQNSAPALVSASHSIGCPQTRARGTIGGNLSNASPAADTAPPLLVLNAEVVIQTATGQNAVPMTEFFIGPGKSILSASDILTSVRFKHPLGRMGSSFLKLGKRKGMAISVASVAAYVHLDNDGCLDEIRLAYGSLAPTPVRGYTVEKNLIGNHPTLDNMQKAAWKCEQDVAPISDLRASASYRLQAARILTIRALQEALTQAEEVRN